MTQNAIPLFTKRRTQYALGAKLPLPEAQVDALIREAIRLTPSPPCKARKCLIAKGI